MFVKKQEIPFFIRRAHQGRTDDLMNAHARSLNCFCVGFATIENPCLDYRFSTSAYMTESHIGIGVIKIDKKR